MYVGAYVGLQISVNRYRPTACNCISIDREAHIDLYIGKGPQPEIMELVLNPEAHIYMPIISAGRVRTRPSITQ